MPTTKVLIPAAAKVVSSAIVAWSSRQDLGPSATSAALQKFVAPAPVSWRSMFTVHDFWSQVSEPLPFGPPSVARSTYLSPATFLPLPVVKQSAAAFSAEAVRIPPAGAGASFA